MIPRVYPRGDDAGEALAEALNRPVCNHEGLPEDTVVAHWPDLDFFTPADERKNWTSADWAEHLNDPNWQHFTVSPQDDRRAIWHANVRLHPEDRALTGPEWSEIAHRLARTADIHSPGDGHGCRWIAVQARPGNLDLIANLIRPDDRWTRQPHRLAELLSDECRRIERDLDLIAPATGPGPAQVTRPSSVHSQLPTRSGGATAQLSRLLNGLAEENTSVLAAVRGLVEHAAHHLDDLPHAYGPATAHQLELIARRLHGIEEDLRGVAHALTSPPAAHSHTAASSPRIPPSAAPTPSGRTPLR